MTKGKQEISKFEKNTIGIAIFFAICGILTFIVSIFAFKNGYTFDSNYKIYSDRFGDFGSFIGGVVGAIWSLVSVILFYITLRLQRQELALQRQDLELTRDELKGQKLELEKANTFSYIQQFDTKFFQLLALHKDITNSIYIDKTSRTYFDMENESGVHFFQQLALKISRIFYKNEYPIDEFGVVETSDRLITTYYKAYHQYKAVLSHYFRNLYYVVNFIDQSKILSDDQKKDYAKILRAQLSQYELVILAYNGMTRYGANFYPLINKYEMLKSIDFELFTPPNYFVKIIKPEVLTEKYEHLKSVYLEQKQIFEDTKKH
jgi:hypothetical protein